MDDLSNRIYEYYSAHFAELPLDKQLHFASRLFFWNNDATYAQKIAGLRASIAPYWPTDSAFVRALYEGSVFPIGQGSAATRSNRAVYFARYPELRRTASTLYWASLLDALYGSNLRQAVGEVLPNKQLQKLYDDLLADNAATAILSTFAVNFMYLFRLYVLGKDGPDPNRFLALANNTSYATDDRAQRQLCIYLLTHTIINDSRFYQRRVPAKRLRSYQTILQRLEELIDEAFPAVSLDNKLEFLVCCRLVGYSARCTERILHEASHSVSPGGTFLVDTKNEYADSPYKDFAQSEHRSVLYLMAAGASRFDA